MPDDPTITFEQDEGHSWDISVTPASGGFTHRWRMHTDTAEQLWRQLDSTIGEYVRERERERRAYEAASPEERERVLGRPAYAVDLDGYELDDPKRITMMEQADEPRGVGLDAGLGFSQMADDMPKVPWIVQWLQPGDPQERTIMYRWTRGFPDGRAGVVEVVRRVDGPGSTWGPGETLFQGWDLDSVRGWMTGRGFTAEQVTYQQ